MRNKQPYIYNSWADWLFIIAPPFICLIIVFTFSPFFAQNYEVNPIQWLVLVMMIDVSHVYSTIYRTYLDPHMRQTKGFLLYATPFTVWILGIILYSFSDLYFWRIMAYLAVFHFIKQQYGIFKIYNRKNELTSIHKYISYVAIYAATIYPVLIWHTSGAKNFTWFVQNDFYLVECKSLIQYLNILYITIAFVYFVMEYQNYNKNKFINIPKNMILLGTALSWYFGIVYYNSDLIFTILNVVSHGVPYMALIWFYGHKKALQKPLSVSFIQNIVFSVKGIITFIFIILFLAYLEESIWDNLIWHDYPQFFYFNQFQNIGLGRNMHILMVPLLSVPQTTHYILDGFIWKGNSKKS